MKMTRRIVILIAVLAIVFILEACAKPAVVPAPEPEPAQNINTYSKWGFSFDYPKEFVLAEAGIFESLATDSSGVVVVEQITQDDYEGCSIGWINTAKSTYESTGGDATLLQGLDIYFDGAATEGYDTTRGEITGETKSGHYLLYQYYIITLSATTEAYGIAGTFYCDHSERLFILDPESTKSSTNEEALEFFRPFLESLKCH